MSRGMWLVVGTAIVLLAQVTAQAPLSADDFGAALEADYVVVGGGTAGCALAARICEGLPNATVVLLERALPRTPEQVRCFLSIKFVLVKAGGKDSRNVGRHCEAYQEDVCQFWRSRYC
jgi:choline dehydrogenase-like flavoprotein